LNDKEDYEASSSITETMNLPSYTELPARMISVITISDTPISSLLKLNNSNSNSNINKNDDEQQQQQDDGDDVFERILQIYWSICLLLVIYMLLFEFE
jgi:hypothetical protein